MVMDTLLIMIRRMISLSNTKMSKDGRLGGIGLVVKTKKNTTVGMLRGLNVPVSLLRLSFPMETSQKNMTKRMTRYKT